MMKVHAIFPKAWKSLPSICHYVKMPSCRFSSTGLPNQALPPLNYIHGKRTVAQNSENFEVREPASGGILGNVQCSGEDEVNEAVSSAGEAFEKWSSLCGSERAEVLYKSADIIRKREDEIAKWDSIDTGGYSFWLFKVKSVVCSTDCGYLNNIMVGWLRGGWLICKLFTTTVL